MSEEKKLGIGGRIRRWFRELRSELKKVSWPSKQQIMNNTWVVMVVTSVCAIAVWGFDFVAQLIVRTLIDFFR
ncbi:MAG: preprotein translocase subunit SecE [Oscillospiraceae bacterium]|nr:preprotein translocase subunit SecE [Oscillospiraceae bacterium]